MTIKTMEESSKKTGLQTTSANNGKTGERQYKMESSCVKYFQKNLLDSVDNFKILWDFDMTLDQARRFASHDLTTKELVR